MIQAIATVLDFAPEHWTPSCRMVALALADRVSADLTCWPSLADISRRTGIAERQVRRYLRQLESEEVISRVGVHTYGLSTPATNLWKWVWAEMPTVSPMTGGGGHPRPPSP